MSSYGLSVHLLHLSLCLCLSLSIGNTWIYILLAVNFLICTLGPTRTWLNPGLGLNSATANPYASYAGNKIPHSVSKYAISHSGYCKNRVNLRRCICLERDRERKGKKKKSPKQLEVLSFWCNFTSVTIAKFSKHELLSLSIPMECSGGCM